MRVRSFSKINLALAVLGKRGDGYHEIRTVYQTIDLHDELEFRPCTRLELRCDGPLSVARDENLVWRAASALRDEVGKGRGAEIILKKRIPAGAGLGGGSGNAAATLLALSRFWELDLHAETLNGLAAGLGSDVPFFLQGGAALGTGRGEVIHPLPDLHPLHLVVVYPGVSVPTARAYDSLNLGLTSTGALPRIQAFLDRLEHGLECPALVFNDFETSVLPAYPAIREAKDALIAGGATAALLSGSGSSVFGFFRNEESALAASRSLVRDSWRVFPAKTLSGAEYHQRMFGS